MIIIKKNNNNNNNNNNKMMMMMMMMMTMTMTMTMTMMMMMMTTTTTTTTTTKTYCVSSLINCCCCCCVPEQWKVCMSICPTWMVQLFYRCTSLIIMPSCTTYITNHSRFDCCFPVLIWSVFFCASFWIKHSALCSTVSSAWVQPLLLL